MDLIENKTYQVVLVGGLVLLAMGLTYYFQHILKTGTLYTHFFYIPIILSCMWWRKKGLYVTAALLGILILGQHVFFQYRLGIDDYVRAFMLVFISLITVGLSDALSSAKAQLTASEIRYRTIFETTGTPMSIIEEDTTLSLVNSEFERLSGYTKAEIENKKSWKEFVPGDQIRIMNGYHKTRRTPANGAPTKYEFNFITREKGMRDILVTIDVIPGTKKSVASFSDVTDFKQTLKRQKELQAELSNALAKVLSGFIPICAKCKKIRNEQDNWIQLESFLSEKTKADFSHGICPQCAEALYSDFMTDESQPAGIKNPT